MACHVELSSMDKNQSVNEIISIRYQKPNTPHAVESRIILEAVKLIKKHRYYRKYKEIVYISDNKKLVKMMNKKVLTHTNVVQDAGDIIGEI